MTAFFSGATVCTELLSPGLVVRASPARMLVTALGVMSLGTLASTAAVENPTALLALAPVRGIGFGAAVVAMSVLVTELAPPRRRGAALGWLGLTTSLPSMFGPALGLALLARVGAAGVFAMGGVATLIGMGLAAPVRQASVAPPAESGSVWRGLKRRDMLVPFAALVLLSAGYGGFVSYAALALPGGAGSTLWNTGVDAGVSIGGVGLALVASRYNLEAVFWALPLFAAASAVVLGVDWTRCLRPESRRAARCK